MTYKPYAVGFCAKISMVILSDGDHAIMTDWLDSDLQPVYETGPEFPLEANFIAYKKLGKLFATDIFNVTRISLH